MKPTSLPYIDNAKVVLITVAINAVAVFLFNWPDGVTYSGVMLDSLFCALITTAIDIWVVYAVLKKMRARGEMPAKVPENALMQRLPQNPFKLGAIYAVGFAALTIGINAVILTFFGLYNMTFAAWAVYKLVYSTLLSVKIVEFCIFRYVQPDWAGEATKAASPATVKNPMPKISVFKEMFGAVTGNIVMNILMGTALGGVRAQPDGSVVISPTTLEGIPITGLIFGLIVGVLVTKAIVKELNATILAYGPAMLEAAATDKKFSWMPVRKGPLTCLVTISVMVFSAVALPSILALFGKPFLNFYQFVVFNTVYATLISKPLSYVLIRRCTQPDYIRYALGNLELLKAL